MQQTLSEAALTALTDRTYAYDSVCFCLEEDGNELMSLCLSLGLD